MTKRIIASFMALLLAVSLLQPGRALAAGTYTITYLSNNGKDKILTQEVDSESPVTTLKLTDDEAPKRASRSIIR